MIPKNPIIPQHPIYIYNGIASTKAPHGDEYDYQSIAVWAAIGFFLGDTTFYKDVKVLLPSCTFKDGKINEPNWNWHYSPRDIGLSQAVDEFSELFEKLIIEQTSGKKIILPISGGLDSRTLAVACQQHKNINYCSYEFQNGFPETKYGEKVAVAVNKPFHRFTIKPGSLWEHLDELADINQCYTEFTHARPFAVVDEMSKLGDIFLLGHWGDVLFDNLDLSDKSSFDELVNMLIKKLVKPGGMEFATALWTSWDLSGNFNNHLKETISMWLGKIKIDNPNARFRAFKSLHWAPRWANSNMGTFTTRKPVFEPYETDEMCKFICTVPENLLKGRKIQIEYIKRKSPKLAKIMWQTHRPFNLNNYNLDKYPLNLAYRIYDKSKRLLRRNKFIQRNWEIQFLGNQNENALVKFIFNNKNIEELIPQELVRDYFDKFKNNNYGFVYPVSMLLALSLFTAQRTGHK